MLLLSLDFVKSDQGLCLSLWYDPLGYFGKLNSTLGSVVPLAIFQILIRLEQHFHKYSIGWMVIPWSSVSLKTSNVNLSFHQFSAPFVKRPLQCRGWRKRKDNLNALFNFNFNLRAIARERSPYRSPCQARSFRQGMMPDQVTTTGGNVASSMNATKNFI